MLKLLENKLFLYFAVCLLVLKIINVLVFVNFPQNIFFADITKVVLTNLVNQGREEAGIQPLMESEKLDLAAELKAEDMVQKRYFSHQSPEGTSPWHWFEAAGYSYKYAGENLAIGFFDSQDVYYAWLNSASHKDNLLNPKYKEIGTAVLTGFGPNNAIVVVQLFGSQSALLTQNQPKEDITSPTEQIEQPEKSISKEVLSQYTENVPLNDYDKTLQYAIYGFLILMFAVLFLGSFAKRGVYRNDLLFRSLIIIIILSAAALLNKEAIYLIFPHQITI